MINIYGQESPHAEVFIIGTKESLARLRDALNVVLEQDKVQIELETSDGEGFNLHIGSSDNHRDLSLPYSNSAHLSTSEGMLYPWKFFENS